MTENVIIIGPMGVGKTTAAKEVSLRLGLDYIDVDELRWGYFEKMSGYTSVDADGFFTYIKPFEARLVETLLAERRSGVFDFGAGYTVYSDLELFGRVKAALEPYSNVILLRYSPDMEESLSALANRHDIPEEMKTAYGEMNKEFITSPCNETLAKHIIDTKGLTPEQTAAAIINCIGMNL